MKLMVTETKKKIKRKKIRNTLTVIEVKHVQVPDAEERLNRVFKILMSRFGSIEKNEANRR